MGWGEDLSGDGDYQSEISCHGQGPQTHLTEMLIVKFQKKTNAIEVKLGELGVGLQRSQGQRQRNKNIKRQGGGGGGGGGS